MRVQIAHGSEDIETSSIIDVLRRGKLDVVVASVEKDNTVKFARGMTVTADANLADVAGSTFDMIALPGGAVGAEHFRDCEALVAMLKAQAAAGRWIAAICASPAIVLVPHSLIGSATMATCHPSFADRLPNKAAPVEERVLVDGKLITSRGPGTAIEFALQCVASLEGVAAAEAVAKPMVMHPIKLV